MGYSGWAGKLNSTLQPGLDIDMSFDVFYKEFYFTGICGLAPGSGAKEEFIYSNKLFKKDYNYTAFNMGIGMVLICSPDNAKQLTKQLPEAKIIGEVVKQVGKVRVVID